MVGRTGERQCCMSSEKPLVPKIVPKENKIEEVKRYGLVVLRKCCSHRTCYEKTEVTESGNHQKTRGEKKTKETIFHYQMTPEGGKNKEPIKNITHIKEG